MGGCRGEGSGQKPARGGSRDRCPASKGSFHFLRQCRGAGYLFKQPQRKPFGQTVKFLNSLLPWCLNKALPKPCVWSWGRGLASLPAGPAQRPAPTPRPAATCASPQTTLEVAPVSVCRPRVPGPLCGLLSAAAPPTWPGTACPTSPCWALPAQTFRLTVARPWLSPRGPGLCVFFFLQSSTKNLKGSVTQGVSEDPQTWFGVSQHLGFIPAFNYCLSHRDLILRNTDDGAP